MREQRKQSGFRTLIAGSILGGILGVLFAPKRGEDTRKEIKDKFDEAVTNIKEEATNARDELESKAEDLRSRAESAVNEIRGNEDVQALEDGAEEVGEDLEETATRIRRNRKNT